MRLKNLKTVNHPEGWPILTPLPTTLCMVDDEEAILEMCTKIFKRADYFRNYQTYVNPDEFLLHLEELPTGSVILLDMNIGAGFEGAGVGVAQSIHALRRDLVIFIHASLKNFDQEMAVAQLKKDGIIKDHIPKPTLDIRAFKETILWAGAGAVFSN